MKTSVKPIMITIVLLIAGSSAINAQRGMGRMMHDTTHMGMMMHDTTRMGRPGGEMNHMRNMNYPMQGQMCPGCGMGMGQWAGHGMRPGMRPGMGWGNGFRGGMGPGQFSRSDMNQRPGQARLENIPNLTDKQKKEIADLRQKQFEEVRKLREDSMAKMKALREDHRKKVMGLLTDEQKKYLENNTGAPAPDSKGPGK
jgi:hypothetical protein